MFAKACRTYERLVCNFGGGSSDRNNLYGRSCLLSPTHVITAYHNVKHAREEYDFAVVSKFDGLFKCELRFQCEDADIAILHATERLRDGQRPAPERYPEISYAPITLGMSVGYMTWLQKIAPNGESRLYLYFSSASVGFRGENEHAHRRWVLPNALIESGFSGSPVFLPNDSLIGVIVGSNCMAQMIEGLSSPLQYWPQISGIPDFGVDLREEVSRAASR